MQSSPRSGPRFGPQLGRRSLLAALAACPGLARAAGERGGTLVIGLDIADTATFDPARQINYTPPLTLAACYDTLVTLAPGRYAEAVPCLAASWARLETGDGWRFRLRPEARFASGHPVTPADVAWSLTRLRRLGSPPAEFMPDLSACVASGPDTVDVMLTPGRPAPLATLAAPSFAILEQAAVAAEGGTDWPDAAASDRATPWLDQHSAGSGAYQLRRWLPGRRIELAPNLNSWRGTPPFAAIEIRHMPSGTAQSVALQRGEIDAACNLAPDEVVALSYNSALRVEAADSLDLVLLLLNADPGLNPALAAREARQAIGAAIDYDAILGAMLGGHGTRPASFLPLGLPGSTPQMAADLGFKQDLAAARALLAAAGVPDGFAMALSYPDIGVAGLSFATLARKLQADLARVGIRAAPTPLHPANWRPAFLGGTLQSTLAFWTSPTPDPAAWGRALLERVAPRIRFAPTATFREVVVGMGTADAARFGEDYQTALVSQAQLLPLVQPSYQVVVRADLGRFPLTGAGWLVDLRTAARTAG